MTFSKNEIRFAQAGDYDDVRYLWDAIFQEDSEAWREWYFKFIYKPENAFLLFHNNKLASMAHFNNYPMMLNSKEIKSAALAGVATYEESRNKGYAAMLIKEGLIEMRKRGIAFSFLYPFSYDFYRKYGYEVCYENQVYTVTSGEGNLEINQADYKPEAETVYKEYTQNLNGYIIRREKYQRIKFLEQSEVGNKAYFIEKDKEIIGYALVEEKKDKVVLNELICPNPLESAKAFCAKYKKSVEFISPYHLGDADFQDKPHCMGRVVDVMSVFSGIPAKKNKMVIKITDNIIKENDGCFVFDSTQGSLVLSKTNLKEDVSIDIKDISAIATGFEKIMNGKTKLIYESLFEKNIPWIVEVC